MMKKQALILALAALLLIPGLALAGGSKDICDTKYPVVLAHGMGASAEILGIMDYWWGIEEALEDEGAEVYITSVNGMDATENKAADFQRQAFQIMAVSGASKINIIGHSHGTIYTRYAMSNLSLGRYVKSHTSIAGPHRGSSIADLIMNGLPSGLLNVGGDVLDFVYAFIFGDDNPQSLENGYDLVTDYMSDVFNPNTPNLSGVYYQSWAAKAKVGCNSVVLTPTWLIMLGYEGANDGLVGVESAKWGKFRGVEDGAWWSLGVDHLNIVGQLFGITPGFDAPDFFVDIVSDLKDRGY
ncbi:esterase/lipase family protein [Desulfatibacillum aliphaticivorans]|uniref:esterase/lipase family protein n=1 Tax=Desulfatibacillum aliphaticivorans TaxID=218208 RepID=UPI00200A0E0A|nr:alpha/beta fold hydrolase [Desulfatibacillum aliphaticivorans]